MCGWQLYVRGVAAGKSGTEALALVNAKRREYHNLSPGERSRWEKEAARVRERAWVLEIAARLLNARVPALVRTRGRVAHQPRPCGHVALRSRLGHT